jgi:hypothetical protein
LGQINELPSYDVSLTIVSETGLIFTIPEGTTELAIVTENCVPFLCDDEIYEGKFFARGFRSVGNNAIVNLKKEIIVDARVTMFVAYTALRDIGEISVTSGAANIKRNTKRDLPVPQDSISDDLSSLIDLARSATTEGSST